MDKPSIAIINASSILTDDEVKEAVSAIQIQLDRDFSPIWFTTAELTFFSKSQDVPLTSWKIYVLDTSDQAGMAGYHNMTSSVQPEAKIFAKTDKDSGINWTVTLSHEILEMIIDPNTITTAFIAQSPTTGFMIAMEIADPVEDDKCGYLINNILVSDFVTPQWFEPGSSGKYSFCGHAPKPLECADGGYLSYYMIGQPGWCERFSNGQVIGPRYQAKAGRMGSRLNRRKNIFR